MKTEAFYWFLALVMPLQLTGCGDCSGGSGGDDGGIVSGTDAGADCADGCLIDAVCYPNGVTNPTNVCEKCEAEFSAATWTNNDGAACFDGAFCNGEDTCGEGSCSVNTGDPCSDDGLFCNGAESCNEIEDRCTSAGNPCAAGDLCQELADSHSCHTPGEAASDNLCNEDSNVVQIDEVGEEIFVEDCVDPAANGTCSNGICGCTPGWTGEECDRCVVYVSMSGDDTNSGLGWDVAKSTVQSGIAAATTGGCDVWVARGTYFPTSGTDRTATIQLVSGVSIYGGFYGGEISFAERDLDYIETVLSGDIGVRDVVDDNSYHVVTGADGAVIDGFTITAGNANLTDGTGGGMLNNSSSPTVTNCRFASNSASKGGGGMSNIHSSPTVTHCTFASNSANDSGGGMYNFSSTPTVSDSRFVSNSAVNGGGMYNMHASPIVSNCTFESNDAGGTGGGMCNSSSSEEDLFSTPVVSDCTFKNNTAFYDGGGMYDHGSWTDLGSSTELTNCLFEANRSTAGHGGGMYSSGYATKLTSCRFKSNEAGYHTAGGGIVYQGHGGGMYNGGRLAEVVDCTFEFNKTTYGHGGGMYIGGPFAKVSGCAFVFNQATYGHGGGVFNGGHSSTELSHSTLVSNSATGTSGHGGAGGGMYNSSCSPVVNNCTFVSNSATGGGMYNEASFPTVNNSILWGNDTPQVYDASTSAPTITHSNVQGGYPGTGNIDADPLFANAVGGDLRLTCPEPGTSNCSPCIDQGNDAAAPPRDKDGNPRRDLPSVANGSGGYSDMGAYEHGEPACGDRGVDPGETCDDGNINAGDGCTATCECEFLGVGPGCPSVSCKQINIDSPGLADGFFWIDPEQTGAPLQTLCDMTRHGGGWTLAVNIRGDSDAHAGNTDAVGVLSKPDQAAKLSDRTINTLTTEGRWLYECGPDKAVFVTNNATNWTSAHTNTESWEMDQDLDGTFDCDADRAGYVFSDYTHCGNDADHTNYGAAGADGCYHAPHLWGQNGRLWAK